VPPAVKAESGSALDSAASIAAAGHDLWGSWIGRLGSGVLVTGATVTLLGFRLRRQHRRAATVLARNPT
jgi:hypothetical protein